MPINSSNANPWNHLCFMFGFMQIRKLADFTNLHPLLDPMIFTHLWNSNICGQKQTCAKKILETKKQGHPILRKKENRWNSFVTCKPRQFRKSLCFPFSQFYFSIYGEVNSKPSPYWCKSLESKIWQIDNEFRSNFTGIGSAHSCGKTRVIRQQVRGLFWF